MTIRFTTLPPSTNNLYLNVGKRRVLTRAARDYKEQAGWAARSQYRGKPLTGPLAVEIQLVWPDKRKHDIDNIKALLDALTGIVWEDDGQIVDLHTLKDIDPSDPHTEVRVWPLAA